MAQPPNSVEHIARRLLQVEAGSGNGVELLAEGVDSALRKLCDSLEPLMGLGGAAAIVGRAIVLTRHGNPALGPVELSRELPLVLAELRAALLDVEALELGAIAADLLANLLRLLVRLLGEQLGMQMIRKSWPDVLAGMNGPSATETEG